MRVLTALALFGFISYSLAAYSTQTDILHGKLQQCVTSTQSDIECITTARDGLQKLSDYIQKVRDLKLKMVRINNGFTTINTVLRLAKYVPSIGPAMNALKRTIDVLKPAFTTALNKVKAVDAKIYPLKPRADQGVQKCDEGINILTIVQTKCTEGKDTVHSARACVNAMSDGNLKRHMGNALETLGGALNPTLATASEALGRIGSTCGSIRRITNIIRGWPDLTSLINAMQNFYNPLRPILNFFALLQRELSRRLCMPDPIENIRELGIRERAAEAIRFAERGRESIRIRERVREGRRVLERARERLIPRIRFRFGKRKRRAVSTDKILLTREEANTYLALDKRGNVCFSIQQILDGLNSIFQPIINLANRAINIVLSRLPSFSLPGMPNFRNLLNLNINFNLPSINFNIDLHFFNQFRSLRWDCGVQVRNACAARNSDVSFDCTTPLGSFGKRELVE